MVKTLTSDTRPTQPVDDDTKVDLNSGRLVEQKIVPTVPAGFATRSASAYQSHNDRLACNIAADGPIGEGGGGSTRGCGTTNQNQSQNQ